MEMHCASPRLTILARPSHAVKVQAKAVDACGNTWTSTTSASSTAQWTFEHTAVGKTPLTVVGSSYLHVIDTIAMSVFGGTDGEPVLTPAMCFAATKNSKRGALNTNPGKPLLCSTCADGCMLPFCLRRGSRGGQALTLLLLLRQMQARSTWGKSWPLMGSAKTTPMPLSAAQ
jgi:hypothetical protein